MKKSMIFLLAAVGLLVTGAVHAQDYPTKSIRWISHGSPGGTTDIVARIMLPRLTKELGQQIVVDNRPGASGNIAVQMAAQAKPDGYTVLIGTNGTMAINPGIFPKFPIKPLRDFIAVTQIVDVPGALVVHPSLPVATLQEFIEYAKARPGKLNYGSSGAGAPFRLAMEIFMSKAGLKIVHIPYKGASGAVTIGVLSNEVSVVFTSLLPVLAHVKSGKLKLLGVTAPKRLAISPDTPTMVESGFPDMTSGAWQGLYVPAGTPRPVVTKLYDAIKRTMADEEVVKRIVDAGNEVVVSKSPDDFALFTKAEIALYEKIINEIGLVGE